MKLIKHVSFILVVSFTFGSAFADVNGRKDDRNLIKVEIFKLNNTGSSKVKYQICFKESTKCEQLGKPYYEQSEVSALAERLKNDAIKNAYSLSSRVRGAADGLNIGGPFGGVTRGVGEFVYIVKYGRSGYALIGGVISGVFGLVAGAVTGAITGAIIAPRNQENQKAIMQVDLMTAILLDYDINILSPDISVDDLSKELEGHLSTI